MAVFNSLTFDGENSLDYGVYITGEAVYNAPERAVELISIPGRNGAIALDQGRFENIEVTYPAGTFGDDQPEFASKIRAFRNTLVSRFNYVKLTDSYHPDEYRLGLYKSGLTTTPVQRSKAGEFPIVFNCKPQRFLTSGETEVDGKAWSNLQTGSGSVVTVNNSDGDLGIKSLVVNISAVQSGSGTASPTNVRAINGWTKARVISAKDNLAGDDGHTIIANTNGVATSTSSYNTTVVRVKSGTTYSAKVSAASTSTYAFYSDYPVVGAVSYNGSRTVVQNQSTFTFSAPINGFVLIRPESGQTLLSVNEGSTIPSSLTDASVYDVPFGSAGTVYGGTLDVTSGLLTVTHGKTTVGALSWSKYDDYFFATIADRASGNFNLLSDTYATTTSSSASGMSDMQIKGGPDNTNVFVKDSTYTVTADFVAGRSTAEIVYELATPQTYQLTPKEIDLMVGSNMIWADSGTVTIQYGNSPVYNPTEFDARPLIRIGGTGTVVVGGTAITITGSSGQTIYIDSESMEIYTLSSGSPKTAASRVSFSGNDFPTLKSGSNTVLLGTGITSVTITPRWWII